MNQQPDKLFRGKLYNYQQPASSNAWNKIDAQLDKKNNKFLWLKVAAAILLLAVAAFILWPHNPDQTRVANTDVKPETQQPKNSKDIVVSPEKASPAGPLTTVDHNKKDLHRTSEKNNKQKSVDVKKEKVKEIETIPPHVVQTDQTSENIAHVQNDIVEESEIISPHQISTAVIAQQENTLTEEEYTSEPEGVTLVYSADEVNEKYLNKKSMAEATSEKKKPSTLRKLLDKAYDLKHNQDPFGDLRQKKNEILALNFKNEKQRSQNK
jgi:hypothetical protein